MIAFVWRAVYDLGVAAGLCCKFCGFVIKLCMLNYLFYLLTLVAVTSNAALQCDGNSEVDKKKKALRANLCGVASEYGALHLAGKLYEVDRKVQDSSFAQKTSITRDFTKKARFALLPREKGEQDILSASLKMACAGLESAFAQACLCVEDSDCALADLVSVHENLLVKYEVFLDADACKFFDGAGLEVGAQEAYGVLVDQLRSMLLAGDLYSDTEVMAFASVKPSEVVLKAHDLLLEDGVTSKKINDFTVNEVEPVAARLSQALSAAKRLPF